jgi:hypothetical protein
MTACGSADCYQRHPEDGDSRFVWNAGNDLPNYMVSQDRKQHSSEYEVNERKRKVKIFLQQAVKAHRVVRRRGSHIDNRLTDSGKVVSLTRRPPFTPSQENSWYSFQLRGWVDPRAIVRLQGFGKLKKSVSSGLEPATFQLVALCLNQLRYRVYDIYWQLNTWSEYVAKKQKRVNERKLIQTNNEGK